MDAGKRLYFKLTEEGSPKGVMTFDACMRWIDEDVAQAIRLNEVDEKEYTLTPIWLTDQEYEALPEAVL